MLRRETKPKILISKSKPDIGEHGSVEVTTLLNVEVDKERAEYEYFYVRNEHGLYDAYDYGGGWDVYDIHRVITRFEPNKIKHNIEFKAHYFINKDNKKGMLHFFPRFWYSKGDEHYFRDWHFRLKFDYDKSKGFKCKMMMQSALTDEKLYEDIDECTFGLLITRFFESCNPHSYYDFNDMFIDIFRNSKYDCLKKYAKLSFGDYEWSKRAQATRNMTQTDTSLLNIFKK